MDFVIIARKDRLMCSQDVFNSLLTPTKEKSGNKSFKLLIAPDTNAVSISCQIYLVRKDLNNATNWQILSDWCLEYRKIEQAQQWVANNKKFIGKL